MLLKLSGIHMTYRRALRKVKLVRIVKKTLSGVSRSLWQLNQISEESYRIFYAIGLNLAIHAESAASTAAMSFFSAIKQNAFAGVKTRSSGVEVK